MTPRLPMCCAPEAFELLASQLPTINSPDALLHCACAVAMHQHPDLEAGAVDGLLQHYADTIRCRVRGSQPQALLAHMHELLFDEQEFEGNTSDYFNSSISYIPSFLVT